MKEGLIELREIVRDYSQYITLSIVVLALLWVQWITFRPRKKLPVDTMRDITMTEKGRKLHIERVVLERICDGILEAVINGEINDDEANKEMVKLAEVYNHPELVPIIRRKKAPMLKAQLKNNERRRKLRGKERRERLPIPEPKSVKTVAKDPDSLASILEG